MRGSLNNYDCIWIKSSCFHTGYQVCCSVFPYALNTFGEGSAHEKNAFSCTGSWSLRHDYGDTRQGNIHTFRFQKFHLRGMCLNVIVFYVCLLQPFQEVTGPPRGEREYPVEDYSTTSRVLPS